MPSKMQLKYLHEELLVGWEARLYVDESSSWRKLLEAKILRIKKSERLKAPAVKTPSGENSGG